MARFESEFLKQQNARLEHSGFNSVQRRIAEENEQRRIERKLEREREDERIRRIIREENSR